MYTLAKLDPQAIQPYPSYSWQHQYATWHDLVTDLARRERYANECFYGLGSHILRNGEIIGNCRTFGQLFDTPTRRVTLAQFLAAVADAA